MKQGFDIDSNDNVLFVTEQCNNNCLMCCQPPRKLDDIERLFAQNVEMLQTAPKEMKLLGITGGEPTLLGNRLIELLKITRNYLPNTAIHLLSNGRNFKDANLVRQIHETTGDNFFVGIPLHSDYEADHNLIAGTSHAFEETICGLYNLAAEGIEIELRIVVNSINYHRLPNISDFIYKNLPFVSWVAFMGMERTGYADRNRHSIWVEPMDYRAQLSEAVLSLSGWGIDTCIYNIPRCLLDEKVWPFAKKSISDWKTQFLDCCKQCSQRETCCGLFSTSSSPYIGIKTI